LFERNDYINDTLYNQERFYYNMGGRVRQYIKYNVNDDYDSLGCEANTCNPSFWDWRYRYSPLGGREQKRLYYSPHSDGCEGYTHPWTYYLRGAYGEQLALYYGRQTQEDDTCGNTGQRVYIYPNSYITNGGELVTRADGTKEFSVTDHLGSVRAVVNDQDTTVLSYEYKPFGDTLSTTAGDVARIGFIGQEQDIEHGYFNMGARYYDPEIGRFLSVDPLFEMYTEFSPYNYCNNSPMMFRDPSGMGLVDEIVDGCESIVRSIHEWLFGSDANPLEPGDDGLFGNRGGGGGGGGGDNGLPERSWNEESSMNDVYNGPEMAGPKVSGGSVGGYTNNGYVYSSLSIPESDVNISFGNSYVLGNNLSYAFNYSHVNNIETGYSVFYHPEFGYSFSSLIIGETDYMPFEFAINSITAKMLESGWKVAGSVHTHPSGKSFSMGDLGTILQDFGSPHLTPVVENNSFHIIEGAEYRYIIEVTNTEKFYNWGWGIMQRFTNFSEAAEKAGFEVKKHNETSVGYHRRLNEFFKKFNNTGLIYKRIRK
jgi:RHS repeat-associated protein